MVNLISFDEAIQRSRKDKARHLLLGNGFSIACKPDIFSYSTLYESANFEKEKRLQQLFSKLNTKDFERVIRTLEDSHRVCSVYDSQNIRLGKNLANDAEKLKDILLHAIADMHPDVPGEIENERYVACKKFLSHFISRKDQKGKVYTLNYDLLLYWTLMNDSMEAGEIIELETDDGFGRQKDTPDDIVQWKNDHTRNQRIHYLHGAVHLFDEGAEVYKYTWSGTGTPLLEQAQSAMRENRLPLFVAEGTSEQKMTKIRRNPYLHRSYRSFSEQMNKHEQSLFVYGCSFGENDRHVTESIAKGKIPNLYVALYEDVNSSTSRGIINEVQGIQGRRKEDNCLNVKFFEAMSANVWGKQEED